MRIAGSSSHCLLEWRLKGQAAYSIVELMVTLVVASILLSIAIPGLSEIVANQRIATATADFLAAMNLARAEAIQRGANLELVPANGKEWSSGWIVFVDQNGNQQRDASEPLVFFHGPTPHGLAITSNLTDDSSAYISYGATGRTRTNRSGQQPQSGTITFTLDKRVRKIKINFLGRARACNPAEEPRTC